MSGLLSEKVIWQKNDGDNIIAQINENISLIKELLDEKDKEIEKLKKGKYDTNVIPNFLLLKLIQWFLVS